MDKKEETKKTEIFYTENLKTVPATSKEYDVIVAGGGPGGISAALSAARHGAKVLLIEKRELLGGLATAGLVVYYPPLDDGNGLKVSRSNVEELFYLSTKYGYDNIQPFWKRGANHVTNQEHALYSEVRYFDSGVGGRHNTLFNAAAFALAAEEILLDEGVEIMYDTVITDVMMEGDICKGVIVENLSGRSYYKAKTIIDDTGYGVIFTRAGAEMEKSPNYMTASVIETSFSRMQLGIETGDMTKALHWAGYGYNPARKNALPKTYYATTGEEVNEYIIDQHNVMLDNLKSKRAADKSFVYAEIPSMNSLRRAKRILGLESVKYEDANKYRETSIGCVADWRCRGKVFEIPYGSMFDTKIKNILAVGRIIASIDEAWEVTRVYTGGVLTGQAAGTAAAMSVKKRISPNTLNVAELQRTLEADGVLLHYNPEKVDMYADPEEFLVH